MRLKIYVVAIGLCLGSVRAFATGAPSCEDDLFRAKIAAERAWGPPSTFKSLAHAKTKIAANRLHLKRYLDADQFAQLERTLAAANSVPNASSHFIPPALTEIFDLAVANFTAEFKTMLPHAEHSLRLAAAEAQRLGHPALRATLEQLIKQLGYNVKKMNFTLGVELWAQVPRSLADARAILNALDERGRVEPPRPADEVDTLTILGGPAAREDYRRALAVAFADDEAAARELRRLGKRALGHLDVYGRVPDLNVALGIFESPPRLRPCVSKVCLIGVANVLGTPTEVLVTLDPRERYFTVQTPARRYYQLDVEPDGRLRFLDEVPIPMDVSAKRLGTTHFGY